MRLDDLTPDEIDLVEDACGGLALEIHSPEELVETIARELRWREPKLADRLLGVRAAEMEVLRLYLVERANSLVLAP